jgi:hypothetical protein
VRDFFALLGVLGVVAVACGAGRPRPQAVAKGPLHPAAPPAPPPPPPPPAPGGHADGEGPLYRSWRPDPWGPAHSLN